MPNIQIWYHSNQKRCHSNQNDAIAIENAAKAENVSITATTDAKSLTHLICLMCDDKTEEGDFFSVKPELCFYGNKKTGWVATDLEIWKEKAGSASKLWPLGRIYTPTTKLCHS